MRKRQGTDRKLLNQWSCLHVHIGKQLVFTLVVVDISHEESPSDEIESDAVLFSNSQKEAQVDQIDAKCRKHNYLSKKLILAHGDTEHIVRIVIIFVEYMVSMGIVVQ